MPVFRCDTSHVPVRQFDVAGRNSAESHPDFVTHVGLVSQAHEGLLLGSSLVSLLHMGPPLEIENENRKPINSVGSVGLSFEEIHQIQVFYDEVRPEIDADSARSRDLAYSQYIIFPHFQEPTEDIPLSRFSCVGFVVKAYEYAGIKLVDLENGSLPNVSKSTLIEAYSIRSSPRNRQRLEKFGLRGDGPWQVLLAGYVINSMARDADSIRSSPYVPVPGDEFFPPKRGSDQLAHDEANESETQ